jgi:hypothetical protein
MIFRRVSLDLFLLPYTQPAVTTNLQRAKKLFNLRETLWSKMCEH